MSIWYFKSPDRFRGDLGIMIFFDFVLDKTLWSSSLFLLSNYLRIRPKAGTIPLSRPSWMAFFNAKTRLSLSSRSAIQHELPHWHCYNAPERTGLWWNHQNTNRVLLMYFSVSFPFIFVQLPWFGNWTMFSKKNSHNFKSLSCPLPSKFEHWLPSKIEQLKNICKGPAASGKGRRSTLPHEITNASTNSLWQG